MTLAIVPCFLSDANAFVAQHHRHHRPTVGGLFAVAVDGETVRGVAIVGRPISRVMAWAYQAGRGIVGALVFDGDVAPDEVTRGAEWAFGPRCWTVRAGSAVAFPAAIPCKGKLGFFEPDNGHGDAQSVDVIARRLLAGAPPPRPVRPTEAKLRLRIRTALGEATDSAEAWRRARAAMDLHLGPALGMSSRERWDRMGVHELELLAEALEERAAIAAEGGTA